MKAALSGASLAAIAFAACAAGAQAAEVATGQELAQSGATSGGRTVVVPIPPGPPPGQSPPIVTQPSSPPPAAVTGLSSRVEIIVPFMSGNLNIGDISIGVAPDGGIDLPIDRTLELLGHVASHDTIAKLRLALKDHLRLKLDDLKAVGISATYDTSLLEIVVNVPASDKQLRTLELTTLNRQDLGQFSLPAGLSAWLSWRAALDYVEKGAPKGFVSPNFDLTSAIRYNGWALENDAFIDTAPGALDPVFQRQSSRLVRDWPQQVLRLTIGDLDPVVRDFQASPNMAGISVSHTYSLLEPQLNIRPSGQGGFTLSQPGTVEVYVNGALVRRMDLDSGSYNVQDFPFTSGQNNVQFVVEDPTGRRELFAFNQFFAEDLLASGLSEYEGDVGVESPTMLGQPHYTNRPVFTGFFRHGFSDTVTLGANLQADRDNQLFGGEGVWASPIGIASLQAAVSHSPQGTGAGALFTFDHQNNPAAGQRRIDYGITAEALTANFSSLSTASIVTLNQTTQTPTPLTNESLDIAATFSEDFSVSTTLNADVGYTIARGDERSGARARVAIAQRLGFATSVDFELRWDERGLSSTTVGSGRNDVGVFISLSHRFGRDQTVRATYDSGTDEAIATYQRTPRDPYNDWALSGEVDHEGGATTVDASAYREFNRVEATFEQTAATDTSGHVEDIRTSVQLAGSIAYADGAVAIGRPIYDAFAIIEPHPNLRGAEISVDPQPDGGADAKTDFLGPALVPDLSGYSRRTLYIGVNKAPPGYDIGSGSFDLFPPHDGGYKLVVGSDYSITAIGDLLDQDGQPLALIAGRALEIGHPEHAPIEIFTTRSGRFALQGLRPGRWRIEMGLQPIVYILEIKPGASTLLRLADPIRPSQEGGK